MYSEEDNLLLLKTCGRFFFFLAALAFAVGFLQLCQGQWAPALGSLLGVSIFAWLAWWALAAPTIGRDSGFQDNPGFAGAGKPVPIGPAPTHHLAAAKEFPPSDKTRSFPID